MHYAHANDKVEPGFVYSIDSAQVAALLRIEKGGGKNQNQYLPVPVEAQTITSAK